VGSCENADATTHASPTTEPEDKSMPPETITPVTPRAMRPMTEICLTILIKFILVRNAGEMIEAMMNIARNIKNIP